MKGGRELKRDLENTIGDDRMEQDEIQLENEIVKKKITLSDLDNWIDWSLTIV